jgi:hypothetical protein
LANDPEAQAQIARLLGDEGLKAAGAAELHTAVDAGFTRLVEGLVMEAGASDDVIDRASALAFLDDRLRFLEPVIDREQRQRLREVLEAKLETW